MRLLLLLLFSVVVVSPLTINLENFTSPPQKHTLLNKLFSFRPFRTFALSNITISIEEGSSHAFIGTSDSGKSSLLRQLQLIADDSRDCFSVVSLAAGDGTISSSTSPPNLSRSELILDTISSFCTLPLPTLLLLDEYLDKETTAIRHQVYSKLMSNPAFSLLVATHKKSDASLFQHLHELSAGRIIK